MTARSVSVCVMAVPTEPSSPERRGLRALLGGSKRISPTAHYTGATWARAGLSHPSLSTVEGRILLHSLRPLMAISRTVGGPRLEDFLLARHTMIDHLLTRAIEEGRVSQVVEIASGLSPRGWRFAKNHGDRLTYIEADLPAMAQRKRDSLTRAKQLSPRHRIVAVDAMKDGGPGSLNELFGELDQTSGVAVITEGLLNYFDRESVSKLWGTIARNLDAFPHGLYLSDIHLQSANAGAAAKGFAALLGAFVRGRIHFHFASESEVTSALLAAGFRQATIHRPAEFVDTGVVIPGRGAKLVRVIEAST
jgi:O-methyltransferase involved in polyketide biosynthesis